MKETLTRRVEQDKENIDSNCGEGSKGTLAIPVEHDRQETGIYMWSAIDRKQGPTCGGQTENRDTTCGGHTENRDLPVERDRQKTPAWTFCHSQHSSAP